MQEVSTGKPVDPLNVILVTNDINMRVRANIYGMAVEPFGKKMKKEALHTGLKELILEKPEYAYFKQHGHLRIPIKNVNTDGLLANEYLTLVNIEDENKAAFGRYDLASNSILRIRPINEKVFGITPKNEEQACALDALMDPEVNLVTLIGKAGSGKTLIAIASALELTIERKLYDKILIARPVQPMGKDIGYLPGTLEEKLSPWMQPIFDNLEFLFHNKKRHSGPEEYTTKKKEKRSKPIAPTKGPQLTPDSPKKGKDYDFLIESGIIQVEALTYIRGRSIPKQLIIIDEAQNLTPHEIKTIITRAGEGTKIILTGDTQQIDSPYLDEISNGLTYAVERLKELSITSHVTLFECERSPLAEAGTKYL
jgi:PhoH-like ATPase